MFIKVIIINVPALSALDYAVPESLKAQITLGRVVGVPLKNLLAYGVVVKMMDKSEIEQIRPIEMVLPDTISISPSMVTLAIDLSRHFLTPITDILERMLPTRFSDYAEFTYFTTSTIPNEMDAGTTEIYGWIQLKGSVLSSKFDRAFPAPVAKTKLSRMIAMGMIRRDPIFPRMVASQKTGRTALAKCNPAKLDLREKMIRATPASLERRLLALEYLYNEGLPVDTQWVMASSGCNAADLVKLADLGLIQLNEVPIFRDPLRKVTTGMAEIKPAAMPLKQAAWVQECTSVINLEGKGSPIYLAREPSRMAFEELSENVIGQVIKRGQQAVMVVPDSSLTPNLIRRFIHKWPDQLGLFHSNLTPGERYDTWMRVRAGDIALVIGTHTALLLPFQNLGLILVADAHDPSFYNEWDNGPHALLMASAVGRHANCPVVFSSHTPPAALVHRATAGIADGLYDTMTLLPLPSEEFQDATIVDLGREWVAGNRSIISRELVNSISASLLRKEQVILFHDRRGEANFVLCQDCGSTLSCVHCEGDLILEGGQLVCRRCRRRIPMPTHCPACSGVRLLKMGFGVEKVESEAKKLFPNATIFRWGSAADESLQELGLNQFVSGHVDILIGTRALAKIDALPRVSTIGILQLNHGLQQSDPFFAEHQFALIRSITRLAQGNRSLKVIYQTYKPKDLTVQSIVQLDPNIFNEFILDFYYHNNYPPFSDMVVLTKSGEDINTLHQDGSRLAGEIRAKCQVAGFAASEVLGPFQDHQSNSNQPFTVKVLLRNVPLNQIFKREAIAGWRAIFDPQRL